MLKELAIQNGYTDHKLHEVLDLICDDLTINLVAETLMDGHLCELTATNKVKAMEPVALFKDGLFHLKTQFPLIEYMEAMGISPQIAMDMVEKAYESARKEASNIGISAPQLPSKTNKWDCWYTVAMVFSDYWTTVKDNLEQAYTLAYEILSDPDK